MSFVDLPPFASPSFTCSFYIEGTNPFTQGCVYLKTLPELGDAVDC